MKRPMVFRKIWLIVQLFRHSWKGWLHSEYFSRSGYYAITSAVIAYLGAGIFIFLAHDYIYGFIMFLLGCFDWMFSWYMWIRKEYKKHYEEKEE